MQVNFRKFVNVTMHDWISFLITSKTLYSFDGHELKIITILRIPLMLILLRVSWQETSTIELYFVHFLKNSS